jgi:hypothetical protein
MALSTQDILRVALIGGGATAIMDAWLLLLQRRGIPTLDFALLGRWVAHAVRGRVRHHAIAKATAVRGELALGWFAHYAVGVAFAAALVGVCGLSWAVDPSLPAALAFGVATVLAPWLVMQPAMGAGIAASRTAAPGVNRLRSLANHGVFGAGLYFAAVAVDWLLP